MATQTLTEEQVVQLVKQLPARSPAQPAAKEGIQPRISRITRIRNALLPIREIREIRGEILDAKAHTASPLLASLHLRESAIRGQTKHRQSGPIKDQSG